MQMLSLIGTIIAVVVMCVMAFRKMNPFIISLLGAVILVLFSGMNLLPTIYDTFNPAVGNFAGNWILWSSLWAPSMAKCWSSAGH